MYPIDDGSSPLQRVRPASYDSGQSSLLHNESLLRDDKFHELVGMLGLETMKVALLHGFHLAYAASSSHPLIIVGAMISTFFLILRGNKSAVVY